MVRTLTCESFKRHGDTVVEGDMGRTRSTSRTDTTGTIHLLVTDIVMPEMGGPELVRRLAPLRRG
ncbi:MAG TPA: hypothetical protein VHF87_04165 [Methylomirabilota bacterium]|jgi:CheY-like chemotaxis protein|nr:hypothetical protein [Methylomirabilota bacterium]